MSPHRKNPSPEVVQKAVERVLRGEKVPAVAKEEGMGLSTLRKKVRLMLQGGEIMVGKRGPAPLFPKEVETCIFEWIVGMQTTGFPVDPEDVMIKVNEIAMKMFGHEVTRGWFQRFSARHPQLVMRQAQVVSRIRNEVDLSVIQRLLDTLDRLYETYGIDGSRVFNVDETAFMSRKKNRRVLAVRGSRNVWAKAATANFHMSIVACGNAQGFMIPPAFILPGQSVESTILEGGSVPGACVTTTPSGFMNMDLFMTWLTFFSESVPQNIARPLVLVMDGCSSHYSIELVQRALDLEILLVCLPANATHLLQPLDVSCFRSLKKGIIKLIRSFMIDTGAVNIPKADAVRIGCEAWGTSNLEKNIEAGFSATGIYPLSIDAMGTRFGRFKGNGTDTATALWLKHREVIQTEILLLPCEQAKSKATKRKRVDVGGKLLTKELLEKLADEKKKPAAQDVKKKGRGSAKSKVTKKPNPKPTTKTKEMIFVCPDGTSVCLHAVDEAVV